MNKLFEFGGNADILIKTKIATTIGGKSYAAGEPYTILKDTNINMRYDNDNKTANSKVPTLAANGGRPTGITISNVPLTKKVADLIMTYKGGSYNYTKYETVICAEDGKIELSDVPVSDAIFVHNADDTPIEITGHGNAIVLGNFVENERYLVFYTTANNGLRYSFEIPSFPYFEIEVFGLGNTNKKTNTLYMHFDAAKLVAVPRFDITSGGVLNTPLEFDFVYTNHQEPLIVFE